MVLLYVSDTSLSDVRVEDFILRNLKINYRASTNANAPTVIQGNLFEYTEQKDFATNGAIWIGGGTQEVRFYDNVFKINQGGRSTESISRNVGSNVLFERNSVYFEIDSSTTLNTTDFLNAGSCKNNIFEGAGTGTFSNTFTANATNCCFHNFGSSNASGGTNNVFADPLFVDPASSDLRLRPSSPCINAGTAS